MADAVFTLGFTDAEFRRGLRNSENAASRSMGRIGETIKAQTRGVRVFTGALTGLTRAFGVIGVIATAVGAAKALADLAQREAKARAEARKELDAMIGSMRAATDAGVFAAPLDAIAGDANAARSKLGLLGDPDLARNRRIEIDALEERLRFEKLIIPVIDRQVELYRQRARLAVGIMGRDAGGAMTGTGRIDQMQALRDLQMQDARDELLKDQEMAAQLRSQGEPERAAALLRDANERYALAKRLAEIVFRDAEREALYTAQDETDLIRADTLRAEGAFAAAEAVEREVELRQQMRRINGDLYLNERERAEAIENVRRAQEARVETAKRERERAAASFREDIELDALRAQGRDDEADAIERQIALRERLERIEDLRKRGTIDAAEATRLGALARVIADARDPGQFIAAPLGVSASVRSQTLGGGMVTHARAVQQNSQATAENTKATVAMTNELRRVRSGGVQAVYAA